MENPNAALLFFWGELERQVRIEGRAEKISPEESLQYFRTRPRQSQIGALASEQSKPVADRLLLENKFQMLTQEYEGKDVPMPEQWGGFLVKPEYFEFWQGRRSRLHDRISYRTEENSWKIERLSP